jgi:alkanesulfonate monooxygenase SsuD/methylene tetrahydromethanopterin reductase-like flavin-dependent oxidoreductase (luciferase family)
MLFGWHSHFQHRGVPITQMFDEYLSEIQLAEELGYDEIWFTEHHFHPYGLLPSPNLIIATLAGRTERIRIGNMVNVLPLYDPVRLAEEYAITTASSTSTAG